MVVLGFRLSEMPPVGVSTAVLVGERTWVYLLLMVGSWGVVRGRPGVVRWRPGVVRGRLGLNKWLSLCVVRATVVTGPPRDPPTHT